MWMCALFAIGLLVAGTSAEDRISTVGNITTKVLGQSGKIMVYRNDNVSDGITITFSAVGELTTDGERINAHDFRNFAQTTFTFSPLENTTYPDSNVSINTFSFQSNLDLGSDGAAVLTCEVYMFTEDGNITVDGNETLVLEGDMKFNVKIESWPFCNTCQNKGKQVTGEFLDFDVEIKGAKEPEETSEGVFEFGDGGKVLIPKQVIYDGNTTKDMPSGYPKSETKGAKNIFTFRFEKFTSSVFYDPTVSLGKDESGGDSTPEPTTAPTPETETLEDSDVEIKVLGQSGKISMEAKGTGDSERPKVTIELDNVLEMDASGNTIKGNDHRVLTFANQDFEFSTLSDQNYPGTELGVKRLAFHSDLKNGAKITVFMYLFKTSGEIKNENETINVQQGSLKFNVEIQNWPFCTSSTCQNEVGEYLDFEIVMKGNKKASKDKSEGTEQYSLGSGIVTLSREIEVDSKAMEMAEGYPMLDTQGSKEKFKFRFPKFGEKVLYDPVVTLAGGSSVLKAGMVTLFVAMISMVLQKLL